MSEINVTALARVDPAALHGRIHAQVPPPAKVSAAFCACVTGALVRACGSARVFAAHWFARTQCDGAYGPVQDLLANQQRSASPRRRSAPRRRIDVVILDLRCPGLPLA